MAKDKITFTNWWQYECQAANQAWHQMGLAELFWSVGGAILTGGFAWVVGWSNNHDTKVVIFSALFGLVAVFLSRFVIKLLATPAKMAKDQAAKIVEEKRLHQQTIEALEIARNAKAEKVVEQLTEFCKTFLRRISLIKGIDPNGP